ncbi:unnamed protein product, partial [Amoebophrya sp. A25]
KGIAVLQGSSSSSDLVGGLGVVSNGKDHDFYHRRSAEQLAARTTYHHPAEHRRGENAVLEKISTLLETEATRGARGLLRWSGNHDLDAENSPESATTSISKMTLPSVDVGSSPAAEKWSTFLDDMAEDADGMVMDGKHEEQRLARNLA